MGTSTVHTTAYRILVDNRGADKAMAATRKEVTDSKRVLRSIKTPMDRYEDGQRKIANLLQKGLLTRAQANKALEVERAKYNKATSAVKTHTLALKAQQNVAASLKAGLIGIVGVLGVSSIGAFVSRGVRGAVSSVQDSLGSIDVRAKQAKSLGVSNAFLAQQGLTTAENAGLNDQQFSKGIEKMTRRVSEAAAGIGEAKESLIEFKLNAKELNRIGPEKAYYKIADAMRNMTSEQDRLRLAATLFGEKQAKIHTSLAQGSAALLDQGSAADKLGQVLSGIDAQQVEDANDAMGRMATAFDGFSKQFTASLAPALTEIANDLTNILADLNGGGQKGSAINTAAQAGATASMMYRAGIKTILRTASTGKGSELFSLFTHFRNAQAEVQAEDFKTRKANIEKTEKLEKEKQASLAAEQLRLDTERAKQQTKNAGMFGRHLRHGLQGVEGLFGQGADAIKSGFRKAKTTNINPWDLLASLGSEPTSKTQKSTGAFGPGTSIAAGSSEAFRIMNQQTASVELRKVTAAEETAKETRNSSVTLGHILRALADGSLKKEQNDMLARR